jgi:protein-tyrosine phosphatase
VALIDLHLHLLPGVDDGPADLDASLRHAALIAREGVRVATVTPHVGHPDFPLEVATIPARTRELQAALDDAGIELRLLPGGELFPDAARGLDRRTLEVIAHGPAGARWVLFEVPFDGVDAEFVASCRHLRACGFGLVIAHPERAAGLLDEGLDRLRPLLADGAVLQVNACSLFGLHGPEPQLAAERLVGQGLAYILASDGHGGTRGHSLAAGRAAAARAGASPIRVRQLTAANPAFLLEHGIPGARAPQPVAWRSRNERRVRAALDAARRRKTAR